jgi:hypothetical protein
MPVRLADDLQLLIGDRPIANAHWRDTMLTRIVLAVALVLGAAAVAQASSGRDDVGGNTGGYHIGPFGQWLGGRPYRPLYWGYRYPGAYAYGTRYRYRPYPYWRYLP